MSSRRRPKFTGMFHDEVAPDSYWIREAGHLELPPLANAKQLAILGEVLAPDPADPTAAAAVGLQVLLDGHQVPVGGQLNNGAFRLEVALPATDATSTHRLVLKLLGVDGSNVLAWLGRVTGLALLQPWRQQGRNRRLRIQQILVDGETLFDFSNRASPWNTAFTHRFLRVGLNLAGYFRADLGIGESVRCAARAAEAAGLPVALVNLKLPCKNSQTDDSFTARLQADNPHPVNVFHLDAPAARDIDHHHGPTFRAGKYNIGYWAWELPDFPDAWIHFSDYVDEIWAPSDFAARAIAAKVPVPVLAMPHAISFERPEGNSRAKFGLPADKFLFLFLFDLNSYSERKNPAAAIEAFRRSGLASDDAVLVIKVHNTAENPADFARLQASVASLPGTVLITQTLLRREIYELEAACDCFVSLHRAEGFGLALAECMYLGKPVIATDWSATTEFINASNGCPVRYRLVTLERNHGPYGKGQTWAEAEVDHAAEWMRRLCADRALAARLGDAARTTIEEQFAPATIGALYRRRLEAIASW